MSIKKDLVTILTDEHKRALDECVKSMEESLYSFTYADSTWAIDEPLYVTTPNTTATGDYYIFNFPDTVTSGDLSIDYGTSLSFWPSTGLAEDCTDDDITEGKQYMMSKGPETQRVLVKELIGVYGTYVEKVLVAMLSESGDELGDTIVVFDEFEWDAPENEVKIKHKYDDTKNKVYVQGFWD